MRLPAKMTMLLLLALAARPAAWAQAGRASSSPLAFADWLYAQEEYARAAGEYYRYLFTAPANEKPAVFRKIGSSYFRAGEYRRAILVYDRLVASYPESPLVAEAYYEAAYCSFKLGEYDASSALIGRAAAAGPLPPPFILLDAADRLQAGDYEAGALLLDRYRAAPGATARDQAAELLGIAQESKSLPTRSAWAAGLFSFLLPGSGKAYAGRWEDGLVSFLLCAFLGGLAVYSFWSEGSASFKAWAYTALGAVFYVGDIWGSVVAAGQFNAGQKTSLSLRVKARVDVLFP